MKTIINRLKKLQRWFMAVDVYECGSCWMDKETKDEKGEWVKLSDIEEIIKDFEKTDEIALSEGKKANMLFPKPESLKIGIVTDKIYPEIDSRVSKNNVRFETNVRVKRDGVWYLVLLSDNYLILSKKKIDVIKKRFIQLAELTIKNWIASPAPNVRIDLNQKD